MHKLLIAQMFYGFAGIMYNVGSLLDQRAGQQSWASTDAVIGVAGIALYCLFLSAGLMNNKTMYRVLMAASVILLGYGGVLAHIAECRASGFVPVRVDLGIGHRY